MSYIKYQGNPAYNRVNSSTATLCSSGSASSSPALTLANGTFMVVNNGVSVSEFSEFSNISYPANGYLNQTFELCQGETLELFNNDIDQDPLNPSKSYAKGIMLSVKYPAVDETGAETLPANYWIEASYTTLDENYSETDPCTFSIGEAFMHLAPQDSLDSRRLFKSFSITNPSSTFSVKVTALIIKTKTNTDPNNCDC